MAETVTAQDTAPSMPVDTALDSTAPVDTAPVDTAALRDLAFDALRDVAPDGTVGELVAITGDGEVREVTFASLLPGYRAWKWTVEVAVLPQLQPSVLEVALLPGEGALIAPPWVPWADRLADYRRLHPEDAHDDAANDPDDENVDDEDILDDDDAMDDDAIDDDDEVDAVDDHLDTDLEIADPDEFDIVDPEDDDEPDDGVPEPDDATRA
ncbi:DUF3027 domain-containing protein [uncultured Amnibacterium sp.]|uniref:DUF3027 domain-containing protein n=1 Tax=uncultured Amnibacterium sp. TaxID=1631851 RepID=UPI0035CAFC57